MPRTQHRLGPHRDPAVDAAVLAATRELIVELGYGRTTVDGVARRAGVSRPAIYRRWPSKALLVHEAVFPGETVEEREPASFAEALARHVRGAVEVFSTPPARAALPGLIMEMRNDPALRERFAARLEQEARRHFVHDVVAPAVERGEVRPAVDADTVFDAITGAVVVAACVREVDDLGAFAASLIDVLLNGCFDRTSVRGDPRVAGAAGGNVP
jgi:AcrR family transcriptional regulator